MLHYVQRSLIYNTQKLERTQISLNGGLDTDNVVYLHNGMLLGKFLFVCLFVLLFQVRVSHVALAVLELTL